MHGLRLWAPLVASCLVATSCSMAKFGYDMLPTWAHWQIERYLSLDEDQRAIVSRRIDELHRWHRRVQLPKYVAFLSEVEDQVRTADPARTASAGSVDAALIARWRDRIGEAWIPVAEHLAPGLAELALTLRPEQIERLRRRLADGDDEYREKFLAETPKARAEARADRVVKRAETFLGRLDSAQVRELRTLAAAMPGHEDDWLAERHRRQKALVALLQKIATEQPGQREATRLTRDYLTSMWTANDERRRARLNAAIGDSDALSAQTLGKATPAQRAHLVKLVRGYADDFRALTGATLATAAR
jgi:hypothetical protein